MSEAEITTFWTDIENCNRNFVMPVINQSPAQLPGLAPQIQFNGLSLLLDIGLACTTPHHNGLHSMFSILKYPSLISELPAFRFRNGTAQIDTHKKKVVSDEFGWWGGLHDRLIPLPEDTILRFSNCGRGRLGGNKCASIKTPRLSRLGTPKPSFDYASRSEGHTDVSQLCCQSDH